MLSSLENHVGVGFPGRVTLRPIQRAVQISVCQWLVQPEFILGYDERRPYQPHARLPFLDQNLPSCEFLAKRNLSVRAYDLYRGLPGESVHMFTRTPTSRPGNARNEI